jgi:AbrB family looped-hinge helix DNA binding protein
MVMVSLYGMKDVLISIDQSGRIVLPKNIRQELAIKPGDVFKVSIHGAAVTLTPSKESAGLVRKGKALVFSTRGDDTLSQEAVQAVLEEGRADAVSLKSAGKTGVDRIYTLTLKHVQAIARKEQSALVAAP